jgi:hypothetical protein
VFFILVLAFLAFVLKRFSKEKQQLVEEDFGDAQS